MSETTLSEPADRPLARSPIAPAPPVIQMAGWEVSGRRSDAALTLTDTTPLAKVQVKAAWNGEMAAALVVGHGRAARDKHGVLIAGSAPGEWLAFAPFDTARTVADRLRALATDRASGELVTVIDLTHGRAVMRLTGDRARDMLAKVCAIDFDDSVTPDGAAFRSSVARLATDVVRDDRDGTPSYLLHCERSSGQYLFDALLDAGREFDIDVDGFRT